MKAYKFGTFERLLATIILLFMWASISVLLITVVVEHGEKEQPTREILWWSNLTMLVSITLAFWLRPIQQALPEITSLAKGVIK